MPVGAIVLLLGAAVWLFHMARESAEVLAEVRRQLMLGVGEPPEPPDSRV